MQTQTPPSVTIRDGTAVIASRLGAPRQVPLVELPPSFLQWQLASRGTLFNQHMAHGDRVTRFDAHLPVLATVFPQGPFPFHTANKGTGLLPRESYLPEDIQAMRALLQRAQGAGWKESLRERVTLMSSLYAQPDHWDRRFLGSLEIFQGQTYANIQQDPRVTLHYTGAGPTYPSFQINAVAQVIGPTSLYYQFLFWARQLFEYDSFHIQQPAYPSGYLFWVCEVFDKSPKGQAGHRIA
ncbi:MAG: hypothetical protein HY685_02905 [Chloroflexi bacterium]|nr:hypothetical protein [Chloroflexota bacterium]